jgi:RHS repeat-associated protein
MTYPNGLNTRYSYDNLNRLLNLSAVHTPTSSTITNFTYTYDAAGNRLTKALPDYTETYKYDALYRLTQAERTGSLTGMQTWSYDPVGNRLTNQKDAAVITNSYNEKNQLISSTGGGLMLWRGSLDEPGTVTFTSALVNGRPARMVPGNVFETLLPMNVGSNTVTLEARDTTGNLRTKSYSVDVTGDGATYTNDANGNLSQKVAGADTWVYTWDAENRLKRVENNGVEVASFEYDAIGRRVEKLDGGVTTTFSYDGPGIIRLGVGSTITTYVHDLGIDKPLRAEDGTGTLSFVNADGLGSAVSSANAAGEVTSTARYDAWGNIEAGAANRYGFTGREPDQTGLAYYRARYYDPKIGRFISEDPIGFKGGLNLYRYVENKPNDRVDPFGLESGNINQMVPGPGNTPMFPWPTPCKPSSCMQRCLARIFGTLPPITVMPNAAGVAPALGYAISGYRSIDLPVSCDTFYGEPDWVLHEYYHVLQQWERGPTLFGARYVAQAVAHGFQHDRIPAEQQAEAFAQMLSGALERCLESCKCN